MHTTHARTYKGNAVREQIHDLTTPIAVVAPKNEADMPVAMRQRNEHLLNERYFQGRRTAIRVSFEVYCRAGMRPLNYSRLAGRHLLVDCPTPRQAKATIRLLQQVVQQLNAKFLDEQGSSDGIGVVMRPKRREPQPA